MLSRISPGWQSRVRNYPVARDVHALCVNIDRVHEIRPGARSAKQVGGLSRHRSCQKLLFENGLPSRQNGTMTGSHLHVGTRPNLVHPPISQRSVGCSVAVFRARIPVAAEFRFGDDELDGRAGGTHGDEPAESIDCGPCANRQQLLSAQASLKQGLGFVQARPWNRPALVHRLCWFRVRVRD